VADTVIDRVRGKLLPSRDDTESVKMEHSVTRAAPWLVQALYTSSRESVSLLSQLLISARGLRSCYLKR